jgi:hypothetical protein
MANKFLCNKRGLSTIVVTLLLIVISLVAVGVLWGFVNNMIHKQISSNEACYGNFDKVQINKAYTCYEVMPGGTSYNIRFSIALQDVNVDKLIIGVYSASAIKSYELNSTPLTIVGLKPVPSGTTVKLPDKNSGLTYNGTGFSDKIDSIQITPVIGGTQCQVADSLSQIEDCALLA